MTYTIGEAAKEFGIAASAIRYYDSLGILPGLTRKGGTRIFDEKGMERLRLIECYKLSGMNMREIVAIFALVYVTYQIFISGLMVPMFSDAYPCIWMPLADNFFLPALFAVLVCYGEYKARKARKNQPL